MNKKQRNTQTLYFGLGLIVLMAFSCRQKNSIPKEIQSIPVQVTIERFDQQFSQLDTSNLKELKREYNFLFPKKYLDSFWIEKSRDTLHLELVDEVRKTFPDLKLIVLEAELLYKHLKFYYPEIEEPRIISLISEVDYRNRVLLAKNLLLISLDAYLGKDHYFYKDIQKYIREDFEWSQIIPDVARKYAEKIVPRADSRSFVSQMILFGKRTYLLSRILPQNTMEEIFSYSKEEWLWANANEELVWRYFIEKDFLFSTDKNLLPRFLYPAPFSKFYMAYDTTSPDRIGQFIGYRIVCDFMKNNNVSLQQLMEMDSQLIFKKSKYKPQK